MARLLPRPPRQTGNYQQDTFELAKWFDQVWLVLSKGASIDWDSIDFTSSELSDIVSRPHSDLGAIVQADDTSSDTAGEKHVTNALVKKYNDHILLTDNNPHGTNHNQLDNVAGGANQVHVQTTERNELIALDALGAGVVAKTADAAYAARTITGTTEEITVADGSGVSGNPTISLPDRISGPRQFGGATDYAEFEADGTLVFKGDATTFDDLQGSILSLQALGTGVSVNNTENTVDFNTSTNLSDYLFDNYQVRHKWLTGSVIHPHLHWEQAQDNTPNFLIRYRWQVQGQAKTTAWTDYVLDQIAFTYVSGTLNQIAYGAGITPPVGAGLSDVIEIRVYRDNGNASGVFAGADPYTATVSLTFADIHIEEDTLGSRTEYTK